MAIANTPPQSLFSSKFLVQFSTKNLNDGTPFIETYTVAGPTSVKSVSTSLALNVISIGSNKVVIPLTTNTSAGANFLKIYLPQTSSDKLYIAFCKKNAAMSDGYYDYVSGIPTDYRNDLRTFILDSRTFNIKSSPTYAKELKFTVYGLHTNQIYSSIHFSITLSAHFGAQQASNNSTFALASK